MKSDSRAAKRRESERGEAEEEAKERERKDEEERLKSQLGNCAKSSAIRQKS